LLSSEKTFEIFQSNNNTDEHKRETDSLLNENYPNHTLDEFKDNYNEIPSDINYFKIIAHSESVEDITPFEAYHEDRDEEQKSNTFPFIIKSIV